MEAPWASRAWFTHTTTLTEQMMIDQLTRAIDALNAIESKVLADARPYSMSAMRTRLAFSLRRQEFIDWLNECEGNDLHPVVKHVTLVRSPGRNAVTEIATTVELQTGPDYVLEVTVLDPASLLTVDGVLPADGLLTEAIKRVCTTS